MHTHSGKKHWCVPHGTSHCGMHLNTAYTLHSYAAFPRAAIRPTPTGLASPWIPAQAYLHCTTLSFLTSLACVGGWLWGINVLVYCNHTEANYVLVNLPSLNQIIPHLACCGWEGGVGCVCVGGGVAMCKGAAQSLTEANSFPGELLRQKW